MALLRLDLAIALASVSAVFFGFSNICFKLGVEPLGQFTLDRVLSIDFLVELLGSKWILAGVLLTVLSGVFYITAMSYGEVIKVVAVLALSYLVTAMLANVFLEEGLTTFKVGGIALIVLGIVLVHLQA